MGTYGIDNIKKILGLLCEIGNVVEKMLNETGGTAAKLAHIMSVFDEILEVSTFSYTDLKKEIDELDEADYAGILAFMKTKFDLENDALEAKIECALDLLKEIGDLVVKVVAFAKV